VMQQMPWQTTEAQPAKATPKSPESTHPPAPGAGPDSPIPAPTFERRFIQIIRNDEVDKVTDRLVLLCHFRAI